MRIQMTITTTKDATDDQVNALVASMKEIGEDSSVEKVRVAKINPQTATDL